MAALVENRNLRGRARSSQGSSMWQWLGGFTDNLPCVQGSFQHRAFPPWFQAAQSTVSAREPWGDVAFWASSPDGSYQLFPLSPLVGRAWGHQSFVWNWVSFLKGMKEGEGISQRIYMHDPQTQRTVWGWPEGRGQGLGGGRQRWGMGTSVIMSTIKIKLNK